MEVVLVFIAAAVIASSAAKSADARLKVVVAK